nr:hypothetical protein [uncultured Rhodoferax sp.]
MRATPSYLTAHKSLAEHWQRYRRLLFVLLFVGGLLGIVQWTGLRQDFSLAFLRQVLSENRWEGLAAFVLLFTLGNLVQVPGWIFWLRPYGFWAACRAVWLPTWPPVCPARSLSGLFGGWAVTPFSASTIAWPPAC